MKQPTAGQLLQIEKNGFTDDGQFYKASSVENFILTNPEICLSKKEPAVQARSQSEKMIDDLSEVASALRKVGMTVNIAANETIKTMIDSGGKIRDQNTKLASSIESFLKTARSPDFKRAIDDAERLAAALEKIAALDKAGSLGKLANLLK